MLLVALAGLCWYAAGCGSAAMEPAGPEPGEFPDVDATIAAALRAIDATERAIDATPAPTPSAAPDRVEGTPRVALEVSEMTGAAAGGTITLTMAFRDLPRAVEAHYTFRVDALGAAECAGAGMGVTRDIETVDENPERRRAAVAPDCPPGDYFILVTLTAADGVELASDIVRLAVPP